MSVLGGGRIVTAHRNDTGDAMVVWCMLLALMLLPLGGLSVDLWHGIEVQRQLQAAAEDAALAGSSGIDLEHYRVTGCLSLSPASAVALAQANLGAQSGLGPTAGVNIQVSTNDEQISVSLREYVRLTLLSLVEGDRPLPVTATASSTPKGSLSGSGCAVVVSGPRR
jgi:Flp pilus assembly protein TadG